MFKIIYVVYIIGVSKKVRGIKSVINVFGVIFFICFDVCGGEYVIEKRFLCFERFSDADLIKIVFLYCLELFWNFFN